MKDHDVNQADAKRYQWLTTNYLPALQGMLQIPGVRGKDFDHHIDRMIREEEQLKAQADSL